MSQVQGVSANPPAVLASLGTVAPAAPSAAPTETARAPAPAPAPREVRVDEAVRPTREAVELAARRIQDFVKSVGRSLDFSVDGSTGRSILRVVDPQTGEVIRQLPPEETLRVARAVEYMQSMLVNQRA